ncbi:glycosyltransferase [Mycobacterium sp. 1164985.4]|uniref:glycosyltransferase n=1 Tax=Mycobacterium sp. 1164985.4 TaxID=1834069 RepID=UPI0007FE5755|nr:glycosyltransferase [Mycobacterium sp. 1164985.4]OBK73774.1 glycosyl transferase family 1 [Mycobacterium sp. 1164985.4]
MKFVLACYGTRGDVEPFAAIGRELLRRGHDVDLAVTPDQVGIGDLVGLPAVAYGPDFRMVLESDFLRNLWKDFPRSLLMIRHLIESGRRSRELAAQTWSEMSTVLTTLANGADVLVTGLIFEQLAANVAEYYDIPFAMVHVFPIRANGHMLPVLPSTLGRRAMAAYEWLNWRGTKELEDQQRHRLGLSKATGPLVRRMRDRGHLEIQAYDECLVPGLAAEWASSASQRPFVGALTLELPTTADEEVAEWIAAGTPPIFFGFGSMPVESGADTLAMLGAACAELGERALICAGWSDFSNVPHHGHVKVVDAVNYGAIFPSCRAVVHHGGTGTLAAGLRAGVPMLILWMLPDQQIWAARVKRLKVGTARRYGSTTQKSLVADLRTVLSPRCATRAREIARRMTKSTDSVEAAADHLERAARAKRVDGSGDIGPIAG